MANKKLKKRIGGPDDKRLHRRQLFHWIGRDIERNRTLSVVDKTKKYIEYLKNSLTDGLWLKLPETEDKLGSKSEFEITHPICCFTETSVHEIADHTSEYGCLGLGFPKRFVLKNGGMPVHYSSETRTHPAFSSWLRLNKLLDDRRVVESLDHRVLDELNSEFQYVTQFLKRMKPFRSGPAKSVANRRNGKKIAKKNTTKSSMPASRKFGDTLPYLEEREWRIVVKKRVRKVWPKDAVENIKGGHPEWYLPYEAGRDLFTIVVPDSRTLSALMQDGDLLGILFDPSRPPVTLLALEDVGTF